MTNTGEGGERPGLEFLIESARAAERAGAWDEALARYEAALSLARAEGDTTAVAGLLRWTGTVHRERGDLELADRFYAAGLQVAEANGLRAHTADAHNAIGTVAQLRGQLADAEALYGRAHRLAGEIGYDRLAATTVMNLGIIANIRGDVPTALAHYREALDIYERLGDAAMVPRALNNIGMAHVDLSEWEPAVAAYDLALSLATGMGDLEMRGVIELNRAELYLQQRRYLEARESCDRAYEIYRQLGSRTAQTETHKLYGILYRETSKPHLAESHLTLAVELARESGVRLAEAEAEAELALVYLALARNSDALQALNRAHSTFWELQAERDVSDVDRSLDRIEGTFLRVVEQWGESIEAKDNYTAGHCRRVADLACMLAEHVGINGRELAWFRMGAFLHDVGKIDVPAEILNKPGRLSRSEWEVMASHTVAGDRIVSELGFPWDIRPLVRSHHEHWDGSGYPDGLAGDAIPLPARILGVADIYDALTSERSYRPALSHESALEIMQQEAGTTVDPELLRTFCGLLERRSAVGMDAAAP